MLRRYETQHTGTQNNSQNTLTGLRIQTSLNKHASLLWTPVIVFIVQALGACNIDHVTVIYAFP